MQPPHPWPRRLAPVVAVVDAEIAARGGELRDLETEETACRARGHYLMTGAAGSAAVGAAGPLLFAWTPLGVAAAAGGALAAVVAGCWAMASRRQAADASARASSCRSSLESLHRLRESLAQKEQDALAASEAKRSRLQAERRASQAEELKRMAARAGSVPTVVGDEHVIVNGIRIPRNTVHPNAGAVERGLPVETPGQ